LGDLSTDTQNNPRAHLRARKYQKQIEWRGNKVHELLIRGHRQFEISNTLRISQPTISRDIYYMQAQIQKRNKNYGNELF
jgi:DNA-binding CsgD family transcriptional regulator